MHAPLISVVLPARNAQATLGAALRSLLRQQETDWECVVVDDGSSDDTAFVAARVVEQDGRVRVIRTPPQGLVSALNVGVAEARGTLVARMDADDLMHRDRLRCQAQALAADPHVVAVGCHARLFPRANLTPGRVAYETWLNSLTTEDAIRRDAFVECPIAHPTLMIRREVLREVGYRDVAWPEDYDLLLRLLEQGARVGMVPRRLLWWRDSPHRLSRTDGRYATTRFTDCKAHFLAHGFLASHECYALWGYGDTGRTLSKALAERGRRASQIVDVHPRRIGQRIDGVPVVGLEAVDHLAGQPLVVSVAGARPRAQIRTFLNARGFVERRDYVVAA